MLEELAPEFGTAKVFRPYRDVRFSNDKTPYKTHQGAVVHPDGAGAGAWYVQISADGLHVAGGCWRLESDQVARYRRAVADDVQGPASRPRSSGWRRAGWEIERRAADPRAGRLRRGRDRLELLKHKSLHAGRTWEPAGLAAHAGPWTGPRPPGATCALNTWLADNVGATTKEARRR